MHVTPTTPNQINRTRKLASSVISGGASSSEIAALVVALAKLREQGRSVAADEAIAYAEEALASVEAVA